MRRIKCPSCQSLSTIRKGKRNGSTRFLCKRCHRKFQIKYHLKRSGRHLLTLYLDGVPLRKIAEEEKTSPMTVWRECERELKKLPDNLAVSARYCNRYSGFLVFDGKYINVKGYPRGVSFLWGADFFTHDLPHFVFAPSESYQACLSYFATLKRLGYRLKYLVCDDNQAIFQAARDIFPEVVIQLCLNHFLENIRRDLKVRSEVRYREFFAEVETIFKERLNLVEYSTRLREIYQKVRLERKAVNWIDTLIRRKEELLAYQQFPRSPNTTNLIEGYNSHLEGRLHSLKGFQSFLTARLWLNGYVLRRRLKKFTDCEGYFKPLNGTCSLSHTLRRGLFLPQLFT